MNLLSLIIYFSSLPFITMVPFGASNIDADREGIIILEGKYQNKNIYVSNAFGSEGYGYCTYEIRVNGSLITDGINSSAFEIDLNNFKLQIGDAVIIEIRHKNGCTPKVINPGGLTPQPTFIAKDITIEEDGFLEWITTDEFGSLPYIIQQYKWSKWVDVGEVQGKGTPVTNNYAFYVEFISGVNKFRVIQRDGKGKMKKSPSVEITSLMPKLTYVYNKNDQQVIFSGKTKYELYDQFGAIIIRGFGSTVDVSELVKDSYWLSYDNLTENFVKK
ncbi:hypothetical protein OAL26_02150 [Flavobacteriales bacterium]|jgi:hypothetical protein|nr:hypothetical protein [Flavobacteriales bacterium]